MSFIIDQEAWLAYYAEMIGVEVANLGERHLRLALAAYHGVYLPTAATIELRANELDVRQRYFEFGFVPNTPSFATAKLRVALPNAALSTFTLGSPFIVRQGDLAFVATEPLIIPAGATLGEASVVALMQGSAGTPVAGAAQVTVAAGWLRGAATTLHDVVPGSDGDSIGEIREAFRTYAFDPKALVRAEDHAEWVVDTFPEIARVFAHPRTRILPAGGTYAVTQPIAGHLSLALVGENGSLASAQDVENVKEAVLRVTIPYGEEALHVVAAQPRSVSGSISAVIEPGADAAEVGALILDALESHFDWRTWPRGRDVYAGELWAVISSVPNVRFVSSIALAGGPQEIALQPWQYPLSGFDAGDLTLTEAA